MVADLRASTYLVDAVDLSDAATELNHEGGGLWSGLAEDLGVDTFPGIDGGDIGGGVFKPYVLSTMFTISGSDARSVWAAVVALRRRCKPGRTVTLTRQMPDPDGSATNVSHTTTARRVTDRPQWLSRNVKLALDIDWQIEDPWHGDAVAIADAAGTHDIAGDVRTHRMTITLAAGAARTVANTTNGHEFTFSATVPAGGVEVDVEARTATAITGGADLSASLSWKKTYPMRLEAGSNTLTVSAGTASISYQPAYQ